VARHHSSGGARNRRQSRAQANYNCTFTNCEIVFRDVAGVSPLGIAFYLHVHDYQWTFDGPAGLKVNVMTALYQAGVTDLIDQTQCGRTT
jgi:hypothetical protein